LDKPIRHLLGAEHNVAFGGEDVIDLVGDVVAMFTTDVLCDAVAPFVSTQC
jgi:hypothetical protein